jgi:hypothetical protein
MSSHGPSQAVMAITSLYSEVAERVLQEEFSQAEAYHSRNCDINYMHSTAVNDIGPAESICKPAAYSED